jgi:ribonuclease T1
MAAVPSPLVWLALTFLATLAPSSVALGAPALAPDRSEARRAAAVPQRARDTLAAIRERHGETPPGHVGGRFFQNRERRLPRGTYREYDVNPKRPGHPRDAERIVMEQKTGRAYYSGDHYQTFVPMN